MYRKVLAPIDGSATSWRGLDEALRIVKSTGGEMRVLHVVDGIAFAKQYNVFTASADDFREAGKKLMREVMAHVEKQKVRVSFAIVEKPSAAEAIVDEAKKWGADLIVVGTHGRRGINRMVLGSDAEIVLRMASVPVLLVRAKQNAVRTKKKKAGK